MSAKLRTGDDVIVRTSFDCCGFMILISWKDNVCLVAGQDLALQVENETDSVALLPKVVGLLFVQVNIPSMCSFWSLFHLRPTAVTHSWLQCCSSCIFIGPHCVLFLTGTGP